MARRGSFEEVMDRLRCGDEGAAEEVYRRFAHRLAALACRQFDARMRARADHEDVVQSALKSFFCRCERGEFELGSWDAVWALLAVLTVRKCGKRRRFLRAARRNAVREVAWEDGPADCVVPADREPTPEEAAMLAETVERWLAGLGPEERGIVELSLQGYEVGAIAERLRRSERSVKRVRANIEGRLRRRLAAVGETD